MSYLIFWLTRTSKVEKKIHWQINLGSTIRKNVLYDLLDVNRFYPAMPGYSKNFIRRFNYPDILYICIIDFFQ